jgi:hypothetical protein
LTPRDLPPKRDPLASVPPKDFVRARDALAAGLDEKGKSAEARAIRRLRRPSPVVWALNNAASRPGAVSELVDAVDRLRRAQLGQGELRPAIERYRAMIEAFVRDAAARLREAGSPVSAAVERRLQSTLLAAVTDPRLRADLAAGRLNEEQEAPGFDVLAHGLIPATFLRPQPPTESAEQPAGATKRPTGADRPAREPAGRPTGPDRAGRRRREADERAARKAKRLDQAARRKEGAADAADRRVATTQKALLELARRAERLRAEAIEARRAATDASERGRGR